MKLLDIFVDCLIICLNLYICSIIVEIRMNLLIVIRERLTTKEILNKYYVEYQDKDKWKT